MKTTNQDNKKNKTTINPPTKYQERRHKGDILLLLPFFCWTLGRFIKTEPSSKCQQIFYLGAHVRAVCMCVNIFMILCQTYTSIIAALFNDYMLSLNISFFLPHFQMNWHILCERVCEILIHRWKSSVNIQRCTFFIFVPIIWISFSQFLQACLRSCMFYVV